MQLELIFSNEPRFLPSIRAFTQETLRQWPLEASVAQRLGECIVAAVGNAIEHAYPAGEAGSIKLTIHEEQGKLEFLIRDDGLPQDVAALEARLHTPATPPNAPHALALPGADAADEIHWLSYGRDGKAIQIVKWLHSTHVTDVAAEGSLAPFHEDAALAPEQQYTFRRMRPEEAIQVSQLIYRAYGNTYFNEDVYYPERVAAQNANNTVLSFVAAGADGQLVGHYALELNQEGPVAEGGQAVVDPAHRGRGLLDRMKDVALAEAERLALAGWYADAVSVHTMTQQSNVKHGARLTCADLAIAPRTEKFRNISTDLPQRVTCLLFFHWLQPAAPRTIFVPRRHRDIVAAIYQNLDCPVELGPPAATPTAAHGTLQVKLDAGAAAATIAARQLGADTAHLIRHAKREIIERSHAEVVYAELPLADPATPGVAEALELEGFGFLGVAPCFAARGDLLRLAYLVEPLAREPIKTVDDFTARLVDYAVAEQARVQAEL